DLVISGQEAKGAKEFIFAPFSFPNIVFRARGLYVPLDFGLGKTVGGLRVRGKSQTRTADNEHGKEVAPVMGRTPRQGFLLQRRCYSGFRSPKTKVKPERGLRRAEEWIVANGVSKASSFETP